MKRGRDTAGGVKWMNPRPRGGPPLEKNSVAMASNESSGGWTETFTGPRPCAAMVDRLTCDGTVIETDADS